MYVLCTLRFIEYSTSVVWNTVYRYSNDKPVPSQEGEIDPYPGVPTLRYKGRWILKPQNWDGTVD